MDMHHLPADFRDIFPNLAHDAYIVRCLFAYSKGNWVRLDSPLSSELHEDFRVNILYRMNRSEPVGFHFRLSSDEMHKNKRYSSHCRLLDFCCVSEAWTVAHVQLMPGLAQCSPNWKILQRRTQSVGCITVFTNWSIVYTKRSRMHVGTPHFLK